jgi:hypothetical protein
VKGVTSGEAAPGIYELGGPDVDSFRELMQQMLQVIQRRRLIVNMPFWIAAVHGLGASTWLQALTVGLIKNGTSDARPGANLRRDNVVSDGARASPIWGSRRPRWRRSCRSICGPTGPRASMRQSPRRPEPAT